jgi:lactate dehydrogenase-like 2-hydroxyacid dehydrogenase
VGYDYLDVSYCRLHSIHVFNTPGYAGPAVAEYAFALALAAARELREADHDARMSKHIPRSPAFEFYGRSAGIIGLGDIGCHVARIAKGFGMTVWFHNRTPRSSSFGVPVERERLLQTSDVIFITVPLNNDSRLLIGENELSLTKKGTILVSISPDDVIDMSALTRFLKDGRIFAALDLLQPHPELADCPNTVLSIRRAWYTKAAVERRLLTWTSTLAHLGSNTPINRVV